MITDPVPHEKPTGGREPTVGPGVKIFLTAVIAVALVGYVAGLGPPPEAAPLTGGVHGGDHGAADGHGAADENGAVDGQVAVGGVGSAEAPVIPSVGYAELRARSVGPNRDLHAVPQVVPPFAFDLFPSGVSAIDTSAAISSPVGTVSVDELMSSRNWSNLA